MSGSRRSTKTKKSKHVALVKLYDDSLQTFDDRPGVEFSRTETIGGVMGQLGVVSDTGKFVRLALENIPINQKNEE